MDPNATLAAIRRLLAKIYNELPGVEVLTTPLEDDVAELVELVEALDGWLTRGGSLPKHWSGKSRGGI